MTDSQFGNGKILAESLKQEMNQKYEIEIADVKDAAPETIAEGFPDVLILGGAIRMFRGDPKSRKWLKKFASLSENSEKKIKYGTGFLTHALATDKVQGFARRYLNKIKKSTIIESVYPELLTARVQSQEGPIFPEEMEKAKIFAQNFLKWIEKQ
ncbi:MAG: hypothetical protein GF383_08750 [Candidatus Lokiarchaeota archaeon]|nr:hypothetical protein [Candidatus Lokiarchaeota archaeon]MBD3340468.1 hypothetical protein [Candidatus Lokiarchaeota archaeon]